jgi:hypothetical protein
MTRPGRIALLVLSAVAVASLGGAAPAAAQAPQPAVGHVWTIVLNGKGYAKSFGRGARSRYLSRTVRRQGALVANYFGTDHPSLPNLLTLISGQASTARTRAGCPRFDCVYGPEVATLPGRLEAAGRSWKGYVEDLPTECTVPAPGIGDPFRKATAASQYVTRQNPFTYFRSITDDRERCRTRVVGLSQLGTDLAALDTTPAWSLIVPDTCHAGLSATCPDARRPAGYEGVEAFLRRWTPRILGSAAFKQDGLLVILFDDAPGEDSNGGGRVGAVLLSPLIEAGRTLRSPMDHFGYLRSMEELFGLPAAGPDAPTFQSIGAFQPAP